MLRTLSIVASTAATLVGCASSPDTGGPIEHLAGRQAEYCTTADPVRRALLLAVIRTQVPLYPASGLCTDAGRAVADELAERIDAVPNVDTERATGDQRRFTEDHDHE